MQLPSGFYLAGCCVEQSYPPMYDSRRHCSIHIICTNLAVYYTFSVIMRCTSPIIKVVTIAANLVNGDIQYSSLRLSDISLVLQGSADTICQPPSSHSVVSREPSDRPKLQSSYSQHIVTSSLPPPQCRLLGAALLTKPFYLT